MKKFCTLALLLIITLTVIAPDADAQRWTKRRQYASVGVNVGAMNYFGDIVPEPDFTSFRFKSTRPSVGLTYTYRYTPRISGRAAFNWGRVTGDDALSASESEAENAGRYGRNLSFRNDIKEISVVGIVDLFENRSSFQRRPDFVPYAFAGVAVMHHNPKAYYDSSTRRGLSSANNIPTGWYELQPLGTEGQYAEGDNYPEPYKRVQFVIPFGFGVRYKVDRYWDLALEVGWRKTFTDYIDDVSTTYASKANILAGGGENPTAAAILSDRSVEVLPGQAIADPSGTPYSIVKGYGRDRQQRGDTSDDDWYVTTNISLNYILAPRIRSPKFR
ncbi:DUF6089 family protein [Pontibacter rugosus]|uniref:DUF6089 family protein n=1 Tax=Pontibacter rugosus TaxID=1745966 RepID=A0ABW3SLE8_9BACT